MNDHGASTSSDDAIFDLDATAQAQLVNDGHISAVELVDAAIANAERLNPQINAIVIERYERARQEARAAGTGRFAGVPIVLKDLGAEIAGEQTHSGSRGLKEAGYTASATSAVARRLGDAGFVAIGRTNTPEGGTTITTEPLAYGPSRNPWNLDHSTGGSSGGTAAAVAARIVAVGHGSDGGGSIRIPSSECGLVGLKPSRGRVSRAPEGESWAGAATDGALTRTVRDAAALLDVLAGYEPGDHYTAPPLTRPLSAEVGADPGRLRIGFTAGASSGKPIDDECGAAVESTARLLESLGHDVEANSPAALDEQAYVERFIGMISANIANTRDYYEAALGREMTDDDLEGDNLLFSQIGRSMSASRYLDVVAWLSSWSRRLQQWWHGPDAFDVLVCPVLTLSPPRIGWLSGPQAGQRIQQLMLYTSHFNISGQPAISLPLHWSADGLPVGVQLVAAYGREDLLVRLAAQLELAQPWAARRPPICAS